MHSLLIGKITAQVGYDIRFALNEENSTPNLVCLEVQLKNTTEKQWTLAGQNYRLFYNSTKMSFNTGKSMLGNQYQSFTLVQKVEKLDASRINGNLPFAKDLGFLNYAIDLNDVINGGIFLPTGNTWVTTTQLYFTVNTLDDDLALVWARDGSTHAYANSFIEIYEWKAANQTQATTGIEYHDFLIEKNESSAQLNLKAWLQGAYEETVNLMRDDLRVKKLLPLEEPYSTLENYPTDIKAQLTKQALKVLPQVFLKEGPNAIVDWMLISLRNKTDASKVEWSTAGLIQRDGDIVALDGVSYLQIPIIADSCYVTLKHRNHLGVMTRKPVEIINNALITIDFTDLDTPTYGEEATIKLVNERALWGGNADGNTYLILNGGGTSLLDIDRVFFDVFKDNKNVNALYNHVSSGYYSTDTNMDGNVIYQGGKNDIDEMIFYNIYRHPNNTSAFSNFFIKEQIPN